MHNIKLIALDLDGTLLNSEKQLSEKDRAALAYAAEKGIEIVPATGRFYRGMPQIIREEDGVIPIPVEEGLRLNVAVVWRKDDYLTKEAERFVSFCKKAFEAR